MKSEDIKKAKELSDQLSRVSQYSTPKRKIAPPLQKKSSLEFLNNLTGFEKKKETPRFESKVLIPTKISEKDSPRDIADKLNTLEDAVDWKVLKNIPDLKKIEDKANRAHERIDMNDMRWHGGGLSTVSHDGTLTGSGTSSSPLSVVGGGTGDVVGPSSATDNALTRFNSTTGKLVQNSAATLDDDANILLIDPLPPVIDEDPLRAGFKTQHTNGNGTSTYRLSQTSYDVLEVKRIGDTTGDSPAHVLVDFVSPKSATSEDSESTLSLTTRAGAPGNVSRTFDIYNDEYSRDNGGGIRQLYRNTTANPFRFELHDKTVGNGRFTLNEVYAYITNMYVDYVTADMTGVTPSVDDWIWDNGGLYLADDTKITSVSPGVPSATLTRLGINRAVVATGEAVSMRGIAVKETMRLTADRQLLVRKFIATDTDNVAEFGGAVLADSVTAHIIKRAPTVTQSATPTINTDITDVAHITGLAQAITSMTTNLTGTPVQGDTLRIDITDDGTARAITWGSSFESSGNVALPTTTVISTRLDIGFFWNTVTSKWRCVGVA